MANQPADGSKGGGYDAAILGETLTRDFTKDNPGRFLDVSQCVIDGTRFQCVGEGNRKTAVAGQIQPNRSYVATLSFGGSAISGTYPSDTGGRGVDMTRLAADVARRAQDSGFPTIRSENVSCRVNVELDRAYNCTLGADVVVRVTVAEDSTYAVTELNRNPARSFSGSLKSG